MTQSQQIQVYLGLIKVEAEIVGVHNNIGYYCAYMVVKSSGREPVHISAFNMLINIT